MLDSVIKRKELDHIRDDQDVGNKRQCINHDEVHGSLSFRTPESSSSSAISSTPSRSCNDDHDDLPCTSESTIEMSNTRYPQIGKPAPAFKGTAVVNGQFKDIQLSDYKGKYVVLFFYPMDFTFVCPTEIIGFSERAEEFSKINCELIAASTDSHYTHLAWVNTPRKEGGLGSLKIPLLADKNAKISQDYGVYLEGAGVPLRGLFVIDDKQNLRQITINDLPVGRSVDETLRLVQAFQYTDVHGEVCPLNWKPGDATIKPGVESSKEFFQKQN